VLADIGDATNPLQQTLSPSVAMCGRIARILAALQKPALTSAGAGASLVLLDEGGRRHRSGRGRRRWRSPCCAIWPIGRLELPPPTSVSLKALKYGDPRFRERPRWALISRPLSPTYQAAMGASPPCSNGLAIARGLAAFRGT